MRLLAFLAALLITGLAHAAPVQQSGTVSPGHLSCWTTTGVIQDCGTPSNPFITGGFGITSGNQQSIVMNSAAITGAYEQLGLGSTSTGGYITYAPFGGASNQPLNITAPSLNFVINGVTTPFSSITAGASISNNLILSNVSGLTAPPIGNTLSATLDGTLTSTPGSILFRGASGWLALGPGSNLACLTYLTAGPSVAWGSCSGSGGTGTVTSVATNNGLTGGTITTSGTIGLATVSSNNLLANVTGGSAAPTGVTVTGLLDSALGSTRGSILERGVSGWTILTPGTTGYALVSGGAGADPSYSGVLTGTSLAVSGNATVSGTLGVTGALTGSTAVLTSTLQANGPASLNSSLGVAGNGTVGGTLAVTGGLSTSSNLTVGGAATITSNLVVNAGGGSALSVPNGTSLFNTLQTNGSTASTESGWDYSPGGPGAFGPSGVSYAIIAGGSNMLAANYYAVSDERLKSKITEISPAEAARFVQAARPVTYVKGGSPEAGFLAQDQVRAGYGRYVGTAPKEGLPERTDPDGFVSKADLELTLNYNNYIAYLTANEKALIAENVAMKASLAAVNKRLSALEGRRR